MNTVKCSFCGKKVKLIRFGNGWVGQCCDRIAYNNRELPVDNVCGYTETRMASILKDSEYTRKGGNTA